jgi:hypothetical protein
MSPENGIRPKKTPPFISCQAKMLLTAPLWQEAAGLFVVSLHCSAADTCSVASQRWPLAQQSRRVDWHQHGHIQPIRNLVRRWVCHPGFYCGTSCSAAHTIWQGEKLWLGRSSECSKQVLFGLSRCPASVPVWKRKRDYFERDVEPESRSMSD